MRLIKDISYAPENGWRGTGDLLLPDNPRNSQIPVALVIHGGGWNAMDKYGLYPLGKLFALKGFAAFMINYRLLDDAPWPACGDDCLRAAEFLIEKIPMLDKRIIDSPIVVAGASAGGHLALMTGLRLPPEKVSCIISIAGPTDVKSHFASKKNPDPLIYRFFGRRKIGVKDWSNAAPMNFIRKSSPRTICLHSSNDRLVHTRHSEDLICKCRKLGVELELFLFDGNDEFHGMWIPRTDKRDPSKRQFIPCVENKLLSIIGSIKENAGW